MNGEIEGNSGDMQSGSDVNGGAPAHITHLYLFWLLCIFHLLDFPSR